MMEKFVLKCGAGGMSATIAGIVVYPGEVVRLRLMSGEKRFKGIFHTCRLIYRETYSLHNFYRGLGASLLQRVPDMLINFATYETVKYSILDSTQMHTTKDDYA
uniref:Solute carrier family 25 member 33 n=1 Tax=Lygus hesperus TaxID=30085 RepID=A0A0A9WT62_LYGHE